MSDPAARQRVEATIRRLTGRSREATVWVISRLQGGATNCNYKVATDAGDYVLRISDYDSARIGGTRQHGYAIQSAAAKASIAAPVIAHCMPEGHCLTRFIPGATLDGDMLRERRLLDPVARLLRRLHELPPVPFRWSPFRDIARHQAIAQREGLELPPDCDELVAAVTRVRATFAATATTERVLRFCHNDLLLQNFVHDGRRLWLIDWEWAGMANSYFDLGGFVLGSGLSEEETQRFVRAYFGEGGNHDAERARIELMQLVSAMREGLWSVVAAPVLANAWDYHAWASGSFERARRILASPDFDRWLRQAARHP